MEYWQERLGEMQKGSVIGFDFQVDGIEVHSLRLSPVDLPLQAGVQEDAVKVGVFFEHVRSEGWNVLEIRDVEHGCINSDVPSTAMLFGEVVQTFLSSADHHHRCAGFDELGCECPTNAARRSKDQDLLVLKLHCDETRICLDGVNLDEM